MLPTENVQRAKLSADQALLLLDELAGMSSAGVSWSDGLSGLTREVEPCVARAAAQLHEELRQGRSGQSVLENLGVRLGTSMQQLLEIAVQSPQPGRVLSGLVAVTKKANLRHRSMRMAMAYPIVALLFSVIVFAVGWWTAIHPENLFSTLQIHQEPITWLQPITWWPVPMMIGFSIATFAILISYMLRRLRPDYWSRMAWFADLLALQIDAAQPLTTAVKRAAKVAFADSEQASINRWADAHQRGDTSAANDCLPGLLGWTLNAPPQQSGEFATALGRLVPLYTERADRLQTFWRTMLPSVVLCSTVGSMAISYILLTIVPIYQAILTV